MLGNAAFRSEKWDIASKAFRQCTSLDPDNFETWNNLAAAYIKSNQKDKAHTILQEAIKQDYENWKVWENYLWTSTDCGYFDEVLKAYHRLLDLKEKYTDVDVLRIICQAIEQNLNDSKGQPIYTLKSKILQLFGRIVSVIVNESKIYWYYARIVFHFGQINDQDTKETIELSHENADKAFTLLQKSLRCLINEPNWELEVVKCREIIELSIKILDECSKFSNRVQTPKELFASFKLNIKSVINKLKQKYGTDGSDELVYCAELNELFGQIQNSYKEFLVKYF
jgi:tetratricopeptide (TPR) repeat protein